MTHSTSSGQVLPSGTVTFLFTDIEGSTKLAQGHPDKWESLQQRHHAILQSAIESRNGYIFQIIGDAFCAAFHTASDGLNAAIEAQRKLQTENWGETHLKVRMGLHTGSAEIHGNEYRGYMTMARVQRVMSVAYGGQVLLSNASAELTHNEMPEEITLRDMKEHLLKGLLNPEHLWQVIAPDLQQDFPPLQSLNETPNNLPVQLTSFIGREKEVGQIKKRLEKNRLVTLTGSGGVGKTRLSIQVASELLTEHPNGAWLVELAPLADPALVTQAVCTELDVTPQGGMPVLNALTDYLRAKKILLVLDNCEHLIDACAQLTESLLHVCPDLRIIASSREALGIEGESAYRVPSLSLPNSKSGFSAIEGSEAVKLFMERAITTLPDFELTESNAPVVAQICQRLDGIALAIELAASRVKLLTVGQIASRLDDAFRLLTGGSRTALPRQQTLRALIDWSYNLLSDKERTVLRKLSVFMGGWTLEAAEVVCDHAEIIDLLTHLVDKSLVAIDREHGDEVRYYLLETIRQYAREKMSESGEADAIRAQHLAYFLDLARRAEPEVQGADQVLWLDRLEADIDNIRAALEWSLEGGEQGAETGLQMASHLWWFWFSRNSQDGGEWLEKTLASSRTSTDLVSRANALSKLVWVRFFDEGAAEEGMALGQSLGAAGRESVAWVLLGKSAWAWYQTDFPHAQEWAEESLRLFREIGDRFSVCEALTWSGMALMQLGEHQQARSHLEESLSLARKARDGNEIAFAVWQLGRVATLQGNYAQATTLMQEALLIYRALKQFGGIVFLLSDLGKASLLQSYYQRAATYYKELLAITWKSGDERWIASSLEKLASVSVAESQSEQASTLFGAAEKIREASNAAMYPFEIEDYERNLESLRPQLDAKTFADCWAKGRTLTLKQVVAYALEELQ